MKLLVKFFLNFLIFTLLLFYSLAPAGASGEFTTTYQVTYEATKEGRLWVIQEISLVNKFSNIYATDYSLTLEGGKPQNISAWDQFGPLEVLPQTKNGATTLNLRFNHPVVGKDKVLNFGLKYEAPELIRKDGQVWEVTIPKLASPEGIDSYSLTLKTPLAFGRPAYISPNPKGEKAEGESQLFFFEKGQVLNAGVVAAFGSFQVFDFSLTYHLQNPTNQPVVTKISLPPDTNYQKLSYQLINPQPENIQVDGDGNWLGIYQLGPKERLKVSALGQVKIFAYPQPRQSSIPTQEELEKYLKPQKYWETENPEILSLAQKLKKPKEIYDFVVRTLDYDYSRVRKGAERFGATLALQSPARAICMEYTDLFIALARAAGIPARELNGFAYTNDPALRPLSLVQDVLHAWPEYWDSQKKTWVQVDPTWQDTTGGVDYFNKLDLGHFVFAIHGEDSQIPPPAGSYKESGVTSKDVQISFGQYKEPVPAYLKVDFLFPKKVITETPTEGKIRVTNPGSEAIYNLNVQILAENFKLGSQANQLIPVLPPFSYQEVLLKLTAQRFLSFGTGKIIVIGDKQKFEYNLTYESVILGKLLPILGGLLAATLIFIVARKTRSLLLQKSGRGNPLRR